MLLPSTCTSIHCCLKHLGSIASSKMETTLEHSTRLLETAGFHTHRNLAKPQMFQSQFHNTNPSPGYKDNVMFSNDFIPATFITDNIYLVWTYSYNIVYENASVCRVVSFSNARRFHSRNPMSEEFIYGCKAWVGVPCILNRYFWRQAKSMNTHHFTLTCMQKIQRWICTPHKMKIVDSQLSLFYLYSLSYCLKTFCC